MDKNPSKSALPDLVRELGSTESGLKLLFITGFRRYLLLNREKHEGELTTAYARGKWPPKAQRCSSGSNSLDSLILSHGFGGVCQTHGPGSSGKSQMLFSSAAHYAVSGRRVLFVDTQGKFRPERVLEIAESISPDAPDPLSHIDVLSTDSPERIEEEVKLRLRADNWYAAVMLDDLAEPYLRGGFSSRQTSSLCSTMRRLSVWSVIFGRHVFVTERVRYDFATRSQRPVGIDFTSPYISCSLLFQRKDGNFIAKDLFSDRNAVFRVDKSGVRD